MPQRKRTSQYTPVKSPRAAYPVTRRSTGGLARAVGRGVRSLATRYGSRALSAYPVARGGLILGRQAYRGYKAMRGQSKPKTKAPVAKGKRKGASMSKSTGFLSANSTLKNPLSRFQNQGVVYHREHGHVVTDSTNNVVYIGHSTCPKRTLMRVCFASLVKTLCKKAGIKIKNWDEPILKNANIPARIALSYKVQDGDQVLIHEFALTVTKTLQELQIDMVNWIDGFNAVTFPQIFLRMAYYHDVGVIGSSRLISYDIDLTSTTFEVHSTSHLKVQNRTINSTGNDQADDVDNVPLYGRIFEMNFNGTTFRDYNQPSTSGQSPQLRTDADFGSLTSAVTTQMALGSSLYNEVALPNQFAGIKSHGKVHMDPGDIKTSRLQFTKTIGLNKLVSLYKMKLGSTGKVEFYFGNTRIIGVEKMITAVALDATNAFNLAFEHDLKIGVICRTTENHQTAVKTELYTGAVTV